MDNLKKLKKHIKESDQCSVWLVNSSKAEALEKVLEIIKKTLDVQNNKNILSDLLNEQKTIEMVGVFMGKSLKNAVITLFESKYKYIKFEKEDVLNERKDIIISQYTNNQVSSKAVYNSSLSFKYRFYLVSSIEHIPKNEIDSAVIFE